MSKPESVQKVWLVRAGGHGEDEETALNAGLAIVGFRDAPDLNRFDSAEAIARALRERDATAPPMRSTNRSRQLWAFKSGIQLGDTVVLPCKTRSGQIALGRAAGPYEYRDLGAEKRHVRRVEWVRPDVPRTSFQQDLLFSFGAFLTICRITRNDAERRTAAVLQGRSDPGPPEHTPDETPSAPSQPEVEAGLPTDIIEAAHDEITAAVRTRFRGHDMARLVEAVLQAEGFITHRSPPGPDGGADILAGMGPLGLDQPTVCVQVKATEGPSDVTIFRALQGSMTTFGASQGLLVCWGGFTQPLRNEARQQAFRITLWDQSNLVQAIYRSYEKLSAEIQAELPLKRVWALVREESEAGS